MYKHEAGQISVAEHIPTLRVIGASPPPRALRVPGDKKPQHTMIQVPILLIEQKLFLQLLAENFRIQWRHGEQTKGYQ